MIGRRKATSEADLQSRQAILWMHPSAILPFMTSQRWVILENHLPADVQFHHVFFDASRQVFGIVCISKDFKKILAGQAAPELPQIKFRYYNPDKDGAIE